MKYERSARSGIVDPPQPETVVAEAVVNAARILGIANAELAPVVGVTPSSLSRMGKGEYRPREGSKEFEACVHFLRLFRSLDAVMSGDEVAARAWLRTPNIGLAALDPDQYVRPRDELAALGVVPLHHIQTLQGLLDAVAYLDSRRARI